MENVTVTDNPDGIRRAAAERFSAYTKTSAYTVKAEDNGKLFHGSAAGSGIVFTLPTPVAGLTFSFGKLNATTDISLQATGGAKINFGTANKIYKNVTDGDGVPATVTIVSDGTDWFVVSKVGTWANDNT